MKEKIIYASISFFNGYCNLYYKKQKTTQGIQAACDFPDVQALPSNVPVLRFDLSEWDAACANTRHNAPECVDFRLPGMFDDPRKFLPLNDYLEAVKARGIIIESAGALSPVQGL